MKNTAATKRVLGLILGFIQIFSFPAFADNQQIEIQNGQPIAVVDALAGNQLQNNVNPVVLAAPNEFVGPLQAVQPAPVIAAAQAIPGEIFRDDAQHLVVTYVSPGPTLGGVPPREGTFKIFDSETGSLIGEQRISSLNYITGPSVVSVNRFNEAQGGLVTLSTRYGTYNHSVESTTFFSLVGNESFTTLGLLERVVSLTPQYQFQMVIPAGTDSIGGPYSREEWEVRVTLSPLTVTRVPHSIPTSNPNYGYIIHNFNPAGFSIAVHNKTTDHVQTIFTSSWWGRYSLSVAKVEVDPSSTFAFIGFDSPYQDSFTEVYDLRSPERRVTILQGSITSVRKEGNILIVETKNNPPVQFDVESGNPTPDANAFSVEYQFQADTLALISQIKTVEVSKSPILFSGQSIAVVAIERRDAGTNALISEQIKIGSVVYDGVLAGSIRVVKNFAIIPLVGASQQIINLNNMTKVVNSSNSIANQLKSCPSCTVQMNAAGNVILSISKYIRRVVFGLYLWERMIYDPRTGRFIATRLYFSRSRS